MAKSKRPLWECPKCGRQFANRNQWHGCTTVTLADCLKGKSAKAVALYHAFEEAVRGCGPVRVHANPSRIGFIARMTFAGAKLKKDWLEAGIILPYRSDSPRVHKFMPYREGGLHFLRIDGLDQIDDELRQWLAEAYLIGKQEAPDTKATPPVRRATSTTAKMRRAPAKRSKSGRRKGKLFYIHWNESELEERLAPLRAAGHVAYGHWNTQTTPKLADNLPDVMIVSLDRLPSHGRAYAGWLWEAKKRQHIPLVFAGGQPEKVAVTRQLFPQAVFCTTEEVPAVVNSLL